jgi:hypothetical protein
LESDVAPKQVLDEIQYRGESDNKNKIKKR